MIRPFRRSDAERYFELLCRYFPEEEVLLGTRPEVVERIARRLFRWDVRLALGFLELIRRPVFRTFGVEAEGKLVATAILTFTKRAGYVGSVMVDTPYQRRGLARQLLHECIRTCRAFGKPYVVLDVLSNNVPARTLYDQLGFRPLREQIVAVNDQMPTAPPATRSASEGLRPFRRSDRNPLTEIARLGLSRAFVEILPPSPREFEVSGFVLRGLESETAAWVLAANGSPNAFVRATRSEATVAGNITAPLLGRAVTAKAAAGLVQTAVDWLAERGVPRIVTEYAAEDLVAANALREGGFRVAHRNWQLYRSSQD